MDDRELVDDDAINGNRSNSTGSHNEGADADQRAGTADQQAGSDGNETGSDNEGARSPVSLSHRLNSLFASVTYESEGRRREYSTPHVANAISEDSSHETTISRVYLNGLRNGSNTNPTVAVVRAIAKFFDDHRDPRAQPVTAAYLLGEETDRTLTDRLADDQVRTIAMRAGKMDDRMRDQVLRMLDVIDPQDAATEERDA